MTAFLIGLSCVRVVAHPRALANITKAPFEGTKVPSKVIIIWISGSCGHPGDNNTTIHDIISYYDTKVLIIIM